jgi:uncharacterized membrane protein YeaQ/YmgE (transglycosylase-associated protein family)
VTFRGIGRELFALHRHYDRIVEAMSHRDRPSVETGAASMFDYVQGGDCNMIGIIIWLVVGGVVGWLASIVMRTDAQQGILLNIVVGIIGAFIGGLLIGGGSINNAITLYSFLVSLLGAIILLAIVNLVRRGSVR